MKGKFELMTVAYAGPPMLVDYAMTKGAQVAMVRCLSNQLLEKGIRVNAGMCMLVWSPSSPLREEIT